MEQTENIPNINKENLNRLNSLMVWSQVEWGMGWEGEWRAVSYHIINTLSHHHKKSQKFIHNPPPTTITLNLLDDSKNKCLQRNSET